MSNVSALRADVDSVRLRRARFVRDQMKAERWSIRQAAMAIGMGPAVLSTRTRGETGFLADEIADIARLLKREPVAFYADYLNASNYDPEGDETCRLTAGCSAIELWRTTGGDHPRYHNGARADLGTPGRPAPEGALVRVDFSRKRTGDCLNRGRIEM